MLVMAVSTVTPLPKSQPDISKLNTFTGYLVTVTKHLQARGTVGQVVFPTQKTSKDNLLALQVGLPLQFGAGFYAFTAADEGGTGEDTWLVKLGTDPQEVSPMAGPLNGAPPTAGGPQGLGEGVIHLGHGFYYNEAMGTLTTPWRTIVSWKQGEPMPQAPASAVPQQQGHLSLVPPNATPWNSGWGGYPVTDESSARVKQLEATIAEDRRVRDEERRSRDLELVRQQTERQMTEMRTMITESNAQFAKLVEKLTTRPAGPDPVVEEMRRKNETLERKLEDDKREREREASENRIREEQRRDRETSERMFRDMQATIAAANANKTDPMMPMLLQVIQSSNANAMEAVKAIQTSSEAAAVAGERQVNQLVTQLQSTIVRPQDILQMVQAAKGDGAEMARSVLDTTKAMVDTQRGVFEQLLDVAGQGGSPPWVQAIEAVSSKIGPIGEAIMAQRAQQAQPQQPRVVVQRVAVPVDAAGRPYQRDANGAIVTPAPAPAPAALSGTAPGEAPTEAGAPAKTPKKKGRKSNGRKGKVPPNGGKVTIESLREMDPNEVAKFADTFVDNTFFGDQLYSHIVTLRQQVTAGMTAEKAADVLLQSRGQLVNISPIPPAVELLMAEQIEVLVERIFPEVAAEFREAVTTLIEEQIESEAEGDENNEDQE